MCLIALALKMHADFPLVIAANRDEFFERPTAPLSEWTSDQGQPIVGGRDLRSGGSWMALTRRGRIAMLTNVRDPSDTRIYGRSRGELVLRWLESDLTVPQWLTQTQSADFAGFNLVVGEQLGRNMHWISNRSVQEGHCVTNAWPWRCEALAETGIYTLSNASLSTPWPKAERLAQTLLSALGLQKGESTGIEEIKSTLWTALTNSEQAPANQMPNTGIDPTLEGALSSVFVDLRDQPKPYGTRSSTLIIHNDSKHAPSDGIGVEITELTWPLAPRLPTISQQHMVV